MNSFKVSTVFFLAFWVVLGVQAQKSISDSSIAMAHISIVFSGSAPGGDFADRFGNTFQIGGETGYKFRNNWYINTGARFLFGGDVRERVAENVTTLVGDGNGGFQAMAIGEDGRFYEVRFFERGFTVPLTVGKIFPVFNKQTPNSGIYVEAGTQFIHHKIKLEVIGNNVPYLNRTYQKGYDRLSTGMGIVEGFGYRFYSRSRLINFHIGFELSQNFTKNRRTVNYDTGVQDDLLRKDLLWGVKVGWTFPIYKQAPHDDYYF